MPSRIRLFDRSGILLYEPSAPAFREWVLNDIGKAEFYIKAEGMEAYINYGNYITIEHDQLPTWVGNIVTPRSWVSPKVISVNARSSMWLFGQRVGSYTQAVEGSWGEVFSQIIGIVNTIEPTLLRIGAYNDGVSFSSIVDMSNIYTYVQRALVMAGTRIDFRPVINNGTLSIYVDILPELYSPSPLKLEEGFNVKSNSPALMEQGEIYNDVTILGVGLEQEKYTANAIDMLSISKYGRRQILFSEGQSQADVDALAVARLNQYKTPRSTIGLIALNKGGAFRYTRAGYTAAVQLKSVGYLNEGLGFKNTAYQKAVQYDDKTGEAVLVCQEI